MAQYVRHTEVWTPTPKQDDDFLGSLLGGALIIFLLIAVWSFIWKFVLIGLAIIFVIGVIMAIMAK